MVVLFCLAAAAGYGANSVTLSRSDAPRSTSRYRSTVNVMSVPGQ